MLRYRASGFMTQMRASEIALIVILSLGAHSYLHAGSILGDVKFNGVALSAMITPMVRSIGVMNPVNFVRALEW